MLKLYALIIQAGLGSWSWSWSEPGVFGSVEPKPTEKKPGARATPKKKTGAGAIYTCS